MSIAIPLYFWTATSYSWLDWGSLSNHASTWFLYRLVCEDTLPILHCIAGSWESREVPYIHSY